MTSDIIIYQTEDGRTKINVRMEDETVWLTQAQMAELFDRDRTVIGRHINNAIEEGEIVAESNVHFLHIAHAGIYAPLIARRYTNNAPLCPYLQGIRAQEKSASWLLRVHP